jgi:hypothetical protein
LIFGPLWGCKTNTGVFLSFQDKDLTLCFSRFFEGIFLSAMNRRAARRREKPTGGSGIETGERIERGSVERLWHCRELAALCWLPRHRRRDLIPCARTDPGTR